ncbi:MAG TPA: hypothetical protein VLF40_05445 [Candidatus Saccharimonadales bacterium]|nr:hypothetical protein [Candidatus Saccharimonadales bacterium]
MSSTYEHDQTLPPIVTAVQAEHSITNVTPFTAGHTGALLYRCTREDGTAGVLKAGIDEGSRAEVQANVYGYESIAASGGGGLLPDGMVFGARQDGSYILMPYLGQNFVEAARAGQAGLYRSLLDAVTDVAGATLRDEADAQAKGLHEFRKQVVRWYRELYARGMVGSAAVEQATLLPADALASDKASLMLLDFTPDNLFVESENDKVTFIDPWRQATYLGSLIPALSQFATLAADVYNLPGAAESQQLFAECADSVGKQLGLTEAQVRKQELLGRCLQFALSGYVRIDTDHERAADYVGRSLAYINQLTEDNR